MRLEQMIEKLKERGHRITPQRLAVLRLLAVSQDHPSVEDIYEKVGAEYPTISLATIYKSVNLLKDLREVLELGFADWGSRYDGNKPYPHPHVVCTECGAIADPDYDSMAQLADSMAKQSGFQITHHRLDFFGVCPECQKKRARGKQFCE